MLCLVIEFCSAQYAWLICDLFLGNAQDNIAEIENRPLDSIALAQFLERTGRV